MTLVDDTETALATSQHRRQALQDGVEALSARLHPPTELAQAFGKSAGSGLARVGGTLRAHPLPSALTAFGLAWLIADSRKPVAQPARSHPLIRRQDEATPGLPPGPADDRPLRPAAQPTSKTAATGSELPILALGLGATALGALMAHELRRHDHGEPGQQGQMAQLLRRETATALTTTENAFQGLIGGVGNDLIEAAQGIVDRALAEASRAVDDLAQAEPSAGTAPGDNT